jgi:hypothetical protein
MTETQNRPGGNRAAHETIQATDWSIPLGPDRLLVGGEWVDRAIHDAAPGEPRDGVPPHPGSWRERVDLATADRALVYRCGLEDGVRLVLEELGHVGGLMVEHFANVDALNRAEAGFQQRHRRAS